MSLRIVFCILYFILWDPFWKPYFIWKSHVNKDYYYYYNYEDSYFLAMHKEHKLDLSSIWISSKQNELIMLCMEKPIHHLSKPVQKAVYCFFHWKFLMTLTVASYVPTN